MRPATGVPGMRAFVYERYGPPETLRMAEVDKPSPEAGEVLVKVLGASVNAADWHVLRGKPLFSRATLGLLRPKHQILGVDVAGRVEGVGDGVTGFKIGDEVYANLLDHGYGGFADYVSVPVAVASLKPAKLSFEEAAAVPMAATTAHQGLGHHGDLQPTHKVLINGASGGVGSFAVQIAKARGAHVTGVCRTAKVDFVRSLGADVVIDYTAEDPTAGDDRYDVILDVGGSHRLSHLRRVLTRRGTLVIVGGETGGRWLGGFDRSLRAVVLSPFVGQTLGMLVSSENGADLRTLGELIESGQVTPAIDHTYPLQDVPTAIRRIADGTVQGKIAITL
jgi:NADPH:quinone reductase-like Zn-dependent oxidoreductase